MKLTSSNFICKYGLFHDVPCIDKEPSSDNGWIYTAYAQELGLTGNYYPAAPYMCVFLKCMVSKRDIVSEFSLIRRPNKSWPPISRDELIGMISLLHFNRSDLPLLLNDDWTWYRKARVKTNGFIAALKALYKIKDKHRDTVWKDSVHDGYLLAFRLLWHDRYFVNKMFNIRPTLFQFVWFQLYSLNTILYGTASEKNVLWLQLKKLRSTFWIKYVKQEENFKEYFQSDHPFNTFNKEWWK